MYELLCSSCGVQIGTSSTEMDENAQVLCMACTPYVEEEENEEEEEEEEEED